MNKKDFEKAKIIASKIETAKNIIEILRGKNVSISGNIMIDSKTVSRSVILSADERERLSCEIEREVDDLECEFERL